MAGGGEDSMFQNNHKEQSSCDAERCAHSDGDAPWRGVSEANYRDLGFAAAIVQQLVVPTFVLNAERKVIVWNAACEALTGMPAHEVIGTRDHWRAFYSTERPCLADLLVEGRLDQVAQYYPIHHAALDLWHGMHTENWCVMPLRGTHLYLEIDAGPIHDETGKLVAVVETLRDMTQRHSAEEKLRLYAKVFEYGGEAILISDSHNRIIAVNHALEMDTGYTKEELLGQDPRILAANKTSPETYQLMWAALRDKESGFWQGELWDLRKDGSTYPKWAAITAVYDAHGAVCNYIASYTDISERKAAEARIAHLAHHDPLTGLFNRYSLENRLAQALLAARRENRQMAVIFIDLDRFKLINDTLGHHVGDLLLIEVAQRLSACVRESDIVARLGGDEFVVALSCLANDMDAAHVAKKILATLASACVIEGRQLHITPSVGISLFPDNGEDVDALMKSADSAMYHAKEMGRNNFQFFSPALTAIATERLEIERDLRRALENQEFELHYQPQVCASNGKVCGVEALIRWRHPQRGLIPPLKFIPVAEETGVIESIGRWVLEEACRQMAQWQQTGFDLQHMAVNVSAHQLRSPHLVDLVQHTMARHGLAPGQLELEITESVAMENPERAIEQLRTLRDSGVELAIDDFGTGYSSLAYLKQLPIHTLKLDRAFVKDIETDTNAAAISAAAISLAHILGLKVVAEGVETAAQQYFLATTHRCDLLQGYLFGKPEPAEVLSARWQTSPSLQNPVNTKH